MSLLLFLKLCHLDSSECYCFIVLLLQLCYSSQVLVLISKHTAAMIGCRLLLVAVSSQRVC